MHLESYERVIHGVCVRVDLFDEVGSQIFEQWKDMKG